MTIELPSAIERYFAADAASSADGISACFTLTAVVVDEGRTYTGRDAIRGWIGTSSTTYNYTVTPFAIVDEGDRVIVTGHLAGDFPGSPTDLRYIFVLEEDRIAELEILP